MTLITKGMGKMAKQVFIKLAKNKTKSKAEQLFDNVYKYSDKKEKAVKSMNEFLKKKKRNISPGMIDRYHAVMTRDPQYKPGYGKKK